LVGVASSLGDEAASEELGHRSGDGLGALDMQEMTDAVDRAVLEIEKRRAQELGDLEVVRYLSVRREEKPLSAAEARMLATARRILASELALALAVTEEDAQHRVDEALALSLPAGAR
jgi:RNA polymerase-interacting CarD/CdnL/TRCF family regulator